MTVKEIAAALRNTSSRSKRELLDKAAEMLDALAQENAALRQMLKEENNPDITELHMVNVDRLMELAKADEEGKIFILPVKPGKPMLCQEHIERPWLMKNVTLCVQYQTSSGIFFYMGYNVFHDLVERGRISPLSEEAEKMLEGRK